MTPDPTELYADIISLPHHRSARREHMPRAERAAQFSAFAALSGHGEAIRETARVTERAPELSEGARAALDARLQELLPHPGVAVHVTWFEADACKAGGAYRSLTTRLRRVDATHRCLILEDGRRLPLEAICGLERAQAFECEE